MFSLLLQPVKGYINVSNSCKKRGRNLIKLEFRDKYKSKEGVGGI